MTCVWSSNWSSNGRDPRGDYCSGLPNQSHACYAVMLSGPVCLRGLCFSQEAIKLNTQAFSTWVSSLLNDGSNGVVPIRVATTMCVYVWAGRGCSASSGGGWWRAVDSRSSFCPAADAFRPFWPIRRPAAFEQCGLPPHVADLAAQLPAVKQSPC